VAQLYANENFPLQVVEALRQFGHDVLTVREAGLDNQRISDADVLAYATANARVLLTINRRDFIRLHRQQPAHHGIIVCTEDADTNGQAQRIHDAINAVPGLEGALIRVNRLER
jgi:predicted nuclease of predicted toxin-antitoxin system